MKTKICMLAAVAGLAFASAANADGIMSFRYVDLDGSYVPNVNPATGGSFTASASGPVLNTSGDLTRLIAPLGTATFAPGFVTNPMTQANAVFSINVANIDNSFPGFPAADGAGSFTLTDNNGDTYTGDISGLLNDGLGWSGVGNTVFFNGNLTNVQFHNNSGDGLFDGDVGSTLGDLGFPGVYEGALVQLFINTGGIFFDAAFSGVPTNTEGLIVPAPSIVGLAGLVGLAAARRRRN